jgi:branched-chain amino acid transport system substrate-binding protein
LKRSVSRTIVLLLISLSGAMPVIAEEVRIGYFGPSDPSHPLGGEMWLAASLAIEEANQAGGFHGRPFRLVPVWSENPWGSGVSQFVRMVYDESVTAVIGSVDGASTHLAEQVVAKARLTLISPAGTDRSVSMARVAWAFSCMPADDEQARVLWEALKEASAEVTFVLVSSNEHDWHHAALAFIDRAARDGASPLYHFEVEPGTRDLSTIAALWADSGPAAVVVLAGPQDSALWVNSLRAVDAEPRIFGGHSIGRRVFIDAVGAAGDGVVFTHGCDPSYLSAPFAETFTERFGARPDCAAAQTYDAVQMLVEAITEAGLDRAAIRDAVAALPPWSGAAGSIAWGPLGQNRRTPRPAVLRDGRILPYSTD